MKAQVLAAPRSVKEREVPVPALGEGDLLVRMEVCALTQKDLLAYEQGPQEGDGPIVLGSQLCGEVVEVASGVTDVRVGQRVAPMDACGRSESWCYVLEEEGCRDCGTWEDQAPPYGGFATYVRIPADRCAAVPDLVDNYDGAMIPSLAAAIGLLEHMRAPLASACILYGEQPVCTALARAAAMAPIIAVDGDEQYLRTARKLGANYTLLDDEEGLAKAAELAAQAPGRLLITQPEHQEKLGAAFDWAAWGPSLSMAAMPYWDRALRLIEYGRIDLRPSYSLAVPLSDLGWAFEQMRTNASLTKIFVSASLTDRFYFESQRKPFEGTVTPG